MRAALAARWQYESLERENLPAPTTVLTVPVQLHTELLPLSLWVSLTSKITGTVEATRLRQKGAVFSAGLLDERQTSVWLTNLKFRYQDGLARWYIEAALRNIFDQKFAYQNTGFPDEARTTVLSGALDLPQNRNEFLICMTEGEGSSPRLWQHSVLH